MLEVVKGAEAVDAKSVPWRYDHPLLRRRRASSIAGCNIILSVKWKQHYPYRADHHKRRSVLLLQQALFTAPRADPVLHTLATVDCNLRHFCARLTMLPSTHEHVLLSRVWAAVWLLASLAFTPADGAPSRAQLLRTQMNMLEFDCVAGVLMQLSRPNSLHALHQILRLHRQMLCSVVLCKGFCN
jgi:hypothetical protein